MESHGWLRSPSRPSPFIHEATAFPAGPPQRSDHTTHSGEYVEKTVQNSSFEVIRLSTESATAESYDNHSLGRVNDHEVRISVMTEPYHWHCHPDSDEIFLAIDGGLLIDFDDRTVELLPGQMITVNKGVRHRTRPLGTRAVNLTFERANARSEAVPAPHD